MIKQGAITSIKFGDAWLINIDELYGNDLDSGGKRLYTKTVYNTDGLTESKFKKSVDRISVEFEASIEDSYRSGTTSVMNGVLTFSQLSNEWITALENNLSESYYLRAVEVKEKFEAYLKEQKLYNRPVSDIKVRDVQMFLNIKKKLVLNWY